MRTPSTIRNVIAGVLLAVFALGITPKRTLHNLIATHKDGRQFSINGGDSDANQISRSAFNCQCENLISESPFVATCEVNSTSYQLVFPSYRHIIIQEVYSSDLFCFGFRGPPAC